MAALIIHSREYGDGSEYANPASSNSISSSIDLDIIPSHYVKRLWRKPTIEIPIFQLGKQSTSSESSNAASLTRFKVEYINKTPNSSDRSVQFHTVQDHQGFVVRLGGADTGEEVARIRWAQGGSSAGGNKVLAERMVEKASVTVGSKTMVVKDFVRKAGLMGSFSQSRTFVGPDGLEYKWKLIYCGNNPVYPDTTYRELYLKNASSAEGKIPLATTERLTGRDGAFKDESHPVYVSQRGLQLLPWIITTLSILEKMDITA